MVCPLLDSGIESKFYLNKESCQKSANQCNLKKDAARLAQEQSNYLYLSALLKTMMDTKGPVIREAIVMRVHDTAFDVLVDDLGLEKRVHLDQLPLESYSYIETTETLKLYWGSQAFKSPDDDSVPSPVGGPSQGQSNLMRFDEGHVGAFDHPDDVTNAYDDERGLFDDESDYEDEDGVSPTGAAGTLRLAEAIEDDSSTDAANMTRVKAFGRLSVLVTADTSVSPSVIKVVAMNPFVTTPTVTLP
ncbi:hypothetical protein BGW38_008104 [Lunasporangiospora selenospora]|uniref:DIS3L2 C-terminal domain-containing protein n=1 Tax=Lunasporangiospora selenospora TaxID=979761 RepID=A0A9P6FKP6_9FUNG|nr:hypothetical protein BGW38_008104 [Lunasporangiospora selenospora]